jgi:hypothetical protein
MAAQRLSQRIGKVEPDGPYEGVPEHLGHGVVHWFEGVCGYRRQGGVDETRLRQLGIFLRTTVNPGWGRNDLMHNLLNDASRDDDAYLDFIDGALQVFGGSHSGPALAKLLDTAGSVWTVAEDNKSLVRVVTDEAQATFDAATSVADEITMQMKEAWANAFGRNGNPSDAWDHAVKAMEALFIPLVVSNQTKPNLGHAVGQLRNQGHLYKLAVPGKDLDHDVAPLVGMLDVIWPNVDRHPGVATTRPPTAEEARAVVTLAATIVQWHRDGSVVQRR